MDIQRTTSRSTDQHREDVVVCLVDSVIWIPQCVELVSECGLANNVQGELGQYRVHVHLHL